MPQTTLNSGRPMAGANAKLAVAPASIPIRLFLNSGRIYLDTRVMVARFAG